MSELNELIGAIEALSSESRLFDLAIAAILRPEIFASSEVAAQYGRAWSPTRGWTLNRADWRWVNEIGVPPYTASIDAAMGLVPSGQHWGVSTWWGLTGAPYGYVLSPLDDLGCNSLFEGRGATPAIALCVAALKAREAVAAPHVSQSGNGAQADDKRT